MSATNVCEGIPYFKTAQQVSKNVSHDIAVRPKAWNYLKFPVRIGRVSKVDFKTNFTMNMTKDKAQSIFCVNDIDLHGMHKGLEERVFQVRDDWAEWVDVA